MRGSVAASFGNEAVTLVRVESEMNRLVKEEKLVRETKFGIHVRRMKPFRGRIISPSAKRKPLPPGGQVNSFCKERCYAGIENDRNTRLLNVWT